MAQMPTFAEEELLRQKGLIHIAGIDEAGRGPLAGPVVAAAVILAPDDNLPWLEQVQDSKKLTARKREFLSACIKAEAPDFGIGVVPAGQIDLLGIVGATRLAMKTAVEQLGLLPDALLIDAVKLPEIPIHQKSMFKGDCISRSIAAASIVAKVHRDAMMKDYDRLYPGYGFGRNMGYGTKEHMESLGEIGCCPIHRASFAPVRRAREKYV
ncbi:MAG: ribonuclease HII [Dehalococcoidia bacterium]